MRRWRFILLPSFFLLACSSALWDVLHGSDRIHARRGDFVDGTTRHAKSWEEVQDRLLDCAEPFAGRRFRPIAMDSLLRGGIWIVPGMVNTYQRRLHSLHMSEHGYTLEDFVRHELGHALSDEFKELRNPADTGNVGGELDHASAFWRQCIPQCPTTSPGCNV